MTGIELGLIGTMAISFVSFLVYKGRVKMEQELLHNRISTLADEISHCITTISSEVKNAKGIASNALSSAQRAESKIDKINLKGLLEKDMGTITIEKKDA